MKWRISRCRPRLLEARRPHVAAPVAHQEIVDALPARDLDALVVDLELLGRLEIVPDEHLPVTTKERRAHLHGGKPVDVHVGDHVVREIERDVGEVLVTVQVRLAGGDDLLGLKTDHVVDDREVVGR